MTSTRLSLITDSEARFKQAERNNELSANNQPVEGEALWTKEDYILQAEHCKSQVEKAHLQARYLQDRMSMRWKED